jgi:hypothetical protein
MTKEKILNAIRRLAAENAGKAPGRRAFFAATGIRDSEWEGVFWIRWSDVITEAGLSPNPIRQAIPHDELLTRLAEFTKELGRFPVAREFKLKARTDRTFPGEKTYRQFGGKNALIAKLRAFCLARGDADTAALCESEGDEEDEASVEQVAHGFVYLVRHGNRREYKIGKTFNPIRREGELRTELPEQLLPVHKIKTDDPSGVERYWHMRFASKRKNGEWFALDVADVVAFKKWRRIS